VNKAVYISQLETKSDYYEFTRYINYKEIILSRAEVAETEVLREKSVVNKLK